jgi:hypothetical protein
MITDSYFNDKNVRVVEGLTTKNDLAPQAG